MVVVLLLAALGRAMISWGLTEEHEIEELLSVGKLFKLRTTPGIPLATTTTSTVLFLSLEVIDVAQLIVLPSLCLVTESHHCVVHSLECLLCLRGSIFVWVQLQCSLFVCFLQFRLSGLPFDPKDLIVTPI